MHKVLTIRVETESHSVYQMREVVSSGVAMLTRLPGPDAAVLIYEPVKVVSYMPIVKGNPFVVTIHDEMDETRTLVSTPVATVDVWLV